jgi:hypothetical protein
MYLLNRQDWQIVMASQDQYVKLQNYGELGMIIAFAGFKGSGKSKAVSTLVQRGFVDVKMAAPLKLMLAAMYDYCGISEQDINRRLEGDLKEQPDDWLMGRTPRHAMQQLGTEWRNTIDPLLWIPMWKRRVQALKPANITCSDIRFVTEVAALRAMGGKLVWINRPGTASDGHVSEQSIAHLADYIIENDHDINQLRSQVLNIARLENQQ